MGLFDTIRYKNHEYQTKDTPKQCLDNYEIRGDGTLWTEDYDSKCVSDSEHILGGYMHCFNHRWVQVENFTGEIRFYRNLDKECKNWEEFSAYFVKGQLKHLENIEPPSD
jgi:hypothetical protein